MAVLKKGIYSEITGQLGGYVYTSVAGVTMVRCKPDPLAPKKPPTKAQLANQEKFKLVSRLIRPFAPVIDVGFKQYKSKIGARAKAFKLNYQTAVTGTFPYLSINYKELQLSTGNASDLYNLKMEDKGGGLFGLTWKSCGCNRSQDDMLVLVLYEETQNSVAYTMELANVSRQQAEFVVCDRIGCKVHVYVFTVGKKKGGNSESQYLGLVA
ncbi:DUF6266 family protein [Pedobacter sp. PLR]|uniref:DUF6266 family protein n=1 Tax=Pedobacter sp. PLR TaxID=2994465 RepID=UPI0022473C56|nr:DUF6266 family protein [Pedobacter sp. PLR]MCX2453384.1 DUF6266 family protein [Pedobacter sp. PLR]